MKRLRISHQPIYVLLRELTQISKIEATKFLGNCKWN